MKRQEDRVIQYVAARGLRAHPRNVRIHSKKQIQQIAESIKQFGFTSPVLVNERMEVLAGHGRLEAAKALGLRFVPIIVLKNLSEAAQRAYLLADNKIAENAGWDRSALAAELVDLSALLPDCGLEVAITGFESAEVDALLGELVDPEQDPIDEPPNALAPATSRAGDIWTLGRHRLICGDGRDKRHMKRLMRDDLAALVFADPPYNVPVKSVQGRGRTKHREFVEGSGEMSRREFTKFLTEALALAAAHSVKGSIHFVCMDWRHLSEMMDAGEAVYTELKNLIVWAKTNAGQGSFYRSQHELIFVWKSGDASHINNFELGQHGRNRSNVWTYAGVNTFKAGRLDELSLHPTVKPVAMVADAIRDCSQRGDIILDPFVGSRTTILAAERVGRRAYALELDPLYVDVAVRRWQAFTKRDAVLESTGETFDERSAAGSAPASRRRSR